MWNKIMKAFLRDEGFSPFSSAPTAIVLEREKERRALGQKKIETKRREKKHGWHPTFTTNFT